MSRLVAGYLDHLSVERGLSEHTVASYRRDLARYADFLAASGIDEAGSIDATVITSYAASLHDGVPTDAQAGELPRWRYRPLAASSTARALAAVRGLHQFAVGEGLAADDPTAKVQPPKVNRKLPDALGIADVQSLLAAPGTADPLGLRDTALLELLYGTGCRISEVVALDTDQLSAVLDQDESITGLRVLGKGNRERFVPLGSYAKQAVSHYLVRSRPELARRGHGSPALLLNAHGGRLRRQGAWLAIQRAVERAGLTAEVSPHTLRHSFATHLLDGGADVRVVQELLGHASVTTTQIYTLVTVDHLREVYLTAHPRAR